MSRLFTSALRTRSSVTRVAMLLTLVVTALWTSFAFAQDEMEYPTIISTEDGVTLPEGLVSGITTVTFQNDSEVDFSPALGRFIDGKTMEDFTAAMMAQDFEGMLATVSVLGSPAVVPGESLNVTYDLQAGDYLFINFNPAGPPTLLPFTVTENEADPVEAPEAGVEVVMVDFAFGMPADLTSGESIWGFTNEGENVHEIVVYKVEEGDTAESVTSAITDAIMSAQPGTNPEIPYESVMSFIGISPGEKAWLTVDLPAGTYAAVCLIPDFSTTPPSTHMHHGMIALLNVSE